MLFRSGIAGLVAIGGTFAYYSAEQTFSNPFNTTNYSTSATEKFNPNGDNNNWEPGSTVDKEVFATNTGDGDVWVRVKFDEAWMRDGILIPVTKDEKVDENHQFGSISGLDKFGIAGAEGGITASNSGAHQGVGEKYETDGVTKEDIGSVVMKNFAEGWDGNWRFNPKDGYFYYKTVLKKGKSTALLLDSVTLCSDTDMGHFLEPIYYIAVEEGAEKPEFDVDAWLVTGDVNSDFGNWKKGVPSKDDPLLKDKDVYTYKGHILDDKALGYAKADYELDITVEFLQTTEEDEIITTSNWDKDYLPTSSSDESTESTTSAPEETTQN